MDDQAIPVLHKLGLVTAIKLYYGDKEFLTIERRNRAGRRYAYIYNKTEVAPVYLNDDGTVSNSYIKTWSVFEE